MTLEQAIRILHPERDTDEISKIRQSLGYEPGASGFNDASLDARRIACEVMQKEAEKHDGCEFCNGMKFLYGDFSGHSSVFSAQRISMHTEDCPDFNFCPMCGKPLNDGKVDGDG